nr:immunoglobulin light chain junction region [Macaca mulatta]
CQQESYWPMF